MGLDFFLSIFALCCFLLLPLMETVARESLKSVVVPLLVPLVSEGMSRVAGEVEVDGLESEGVSMAAALVVLEPERE